MKSMLALAAAVAVLLAAAPSWAQYAPYRYGPGYGSGYGYDSFGHNGVGDNGGTSGTGSGGSTAGSAMHGD